MLRFYFNKRILVGFILALAILSWLSIASIVNTKKFLQSSHMVSHTLDVLYNTERVMTNVANVELGQRGYTITGNPFFLGPYINAKASIEQHLSNLDSLTRDNNSQQIRSQQLRNVIKNLINFSTRTVDLRNVRFDEAREANASGVGKAHMDSIRQIIHEIEAEENTLLIQRSAIRERQLEKFNNAFVALLAATVIILLSIYFAINITFKGRVQAERRLKALSDETRDLYDNAPCGYHSLDPNGIFVEINNTLLTWLGYSREEVVGVLPFTAVIPAEDHTRFFAEFNRFKEIGKATDVEFYFQRKNGSRFPVTLSAAAILDQHGNYLKSRSTTFDITERKKAEERVKVLNNELEAFTYSVSHDLRAPLRSIDGYSRILQEDYTEKLDEEGQRVIRVIMNNAKRMGKLIDDLLDFSRLGRKEISLSNVDMTNFVKSIAHELTEHEKNRNIDIRIKTLHAATVDLDMIRQVWENLLSNAIKYTDRQEHAIIEVNSTEREKDILYEVKDNGVGFDMQYSGKLFGVFQRLHKIQDFSGTGVGLAIVKRIIDRHNGQVGAEGKVNGGAIFYFTIPKQ